MFGDWFFGVLKSWLWWAVKVVRDWVLSVVVGIFEVLIDLLPEDLAMTISEIMPFLEYANQWIPLDLGLVLFSGYWTFSISYSIIRFLIKLIPGVG